MADKIHIENGKVQITTEENRTFELDEANFWQWYRGEVLPPVDGVAMPDGIKFMEFRDPFFLVVHQQSPQVRQLRWITNDSPKKYGPGTQYRQVRISLPFAITFALYVRHGKNLAISGGNELYFRTAPLKNKSDSLFYPAVLNISKIKTPKRYRCWICTQYLRCPPGTDWVGQLQALAEHTWSGAFNLSSEFHEGASWFGDAKDIKPAINPIEKWEEATDADDAFGLRVPWKPVPMTVGQLMETMFEEQTKNAKPNLVGKLLNHVQKK
jgi:hypothetical protein